MSSAANSRLKCLDTITDFGNFKSFTWDSATLGNFDRYNLIYGWNYSGKTTLSRVFQAVEDGAIHKDFVGAKFKFRTGDDTEVSSAFVEPRPTIVVFNREFTLRNFHEGSDMTGANLIAVIGESNQALKRRLEVLQARSSKVADFRTRLITRKTGIQGAIDAGATAQARIINQIVGGPYTRVHLNQTIGGLPSTHMPLPLTAAALEAEKEQFRRAGDFSKVDSFSLSHRSFFSIILKLRDALQEVATNSALETLRANRELERWVDTGLEVNAPHNPCGFCGATVSEERWRELKGHFSEAFAALQRKLQSYQKLIEELVFEHPTIQETALFPELRGNFRAAVENLITSLDQAKEAASRVGHLIRDKLGNLELSQAWTPDLTEAKDLRKAIDEFNKVLKQHNAKVASADEVRSQAKEAICKHFAVEFLRDCEVLLKNDQIRLLEAKSAKCAKTTLAIELQITAANQAIKGASIGAKRLNENLSVLMPDNNILVVKLNDTDFQFQRNGRLARNMSEGERTAIAFSYFLTKVEEGSTPLEEMILVVDDPISSLDENHIYAVHAISESRLAKAKQIFILTHNSNFFGLTKDWMKKLNGRFYMTDRRQDASKQWFSDIVPLPRMLKKFKSAYQWTYYCLKLIDENSSPQIEQLHNVPNMIRSLLEAYLGFVFPESGSWGEKLPRIISNEATCEKIQKFANENSHSHSLSQATEISAYIVHCKAIAREVLAALKAHNPEHVASLEAEFLLETGNLP